MKKSRGNRGQFSIIAALLVSIILVAAVIMTYSMIRHNPSRESPKVLSSIGEINLAIERILEFTVGYYGSILQVTGNTTYAKELAASYFESGLVNIARSHPEWNPSFEVDFQQVSTRWFTPMSYSMGNISVTYSLSGLGMEGLNYKTSSLLKATVLEPANNSQAKVLVMREDNEPELRLRRENFFFYNYSYSDSKWNLVHPDGDPITFSNGTYFLQIPSGVDQDSYLIQAVDPRGIMVTAFYSEDSLVSGIPQYSYTFTWNSSLYSSLTRDTLAVEALQNGTLRWLDQNLLTTGKPIPPIPVKALHVNETVDGVNREVPFQVEDWGSNYRVPLGLTTNTSVLSSRNMLVFLVNHTVQKVTFWWDGRDIANQTSYAWRNIYFTGDDHDNGVLTNGILTLDISNFRITSSVGTSTSTAEFLRINNEKPTYGSAPDYVIHHGVVRDIVQQEAEWGGGISENLYVNGFDWTDSQWSESGSSPYLHDSGSSYIYDDDDLDSEGWFSFQDLSVIGGRLTNVRIQFECRCGGDEYFDFQIDNGTYIFGYYEIDPPDSYGWMEYDLSDILDTVEEVNNARLRVRYRFNTGSAYDVYIRRCRLAIESPNVYSQIVLTLPANAIYYTYAARTIFVNSLQNRTVTDLSAIQLSVSGGQQKTENGTAGGYPVPSNAEGLFYNFSSPTGWAHHWSEFISGNSGAGIMFTDSSNQKLYIFDSIAGDKTGALNVISSGRVIEFNPVERYTAPFTHPLDVTWHGAVVTFDSGSSQDTIYPSSGGNIGLWVIVEHPPIVAVS